MPETPFFSVVIPTYNRAHHIVHTLSTVLKQSYRSFEVIVVDDGSTDNTEEVVASIQTAQVSYYRQKNGERAKARNYGVQQAKGQYITFLDSDDEMYPDCLQEALRIIEANEQAAFVQVGYEMKNVEGKVLYKNNRRKGDLNKQLVRGNLLSCIGVFVRQDIIRQHRFNEDRKLSGTEDWELWLRLASRYRIHYSNQVVAAIINHEERSVLNVEEKTLRLRIDLAMQYAFEDTQVQAYYGSYYHLMYAHLFLYISLHLILSKKKKLGLTYWWRSLRRAPHLLFTRKTLAIFKHLLR
ncbi:MAG: glycosyltransferase family A protein [Bacteroidota bacterium]